MEHVFKHEEEGNLREHGLPGWEGYLVSLHTERFCHRMEQPNLQASCSVHSSAQRCDGTDSRQFDGEMGEKDLFGTLPLLFSSGNFVGLKFPLLEVWHSVDDDPRNATSKVYNLGGGRRQKRPRSTGCTTYFVQQETHETRSNDRVVNPNVP